MSTFSIAAIFSDGCVLQRRADICLFGTGSDGATVEASLSKGGTVLRSATATVRGNGWRAYLAPTEAQDGLELTIRCGGEQRMFRNVAVGEVWLAGGQSNMELELKDCAEGSEELRLAEAPDVRFYYTQKRARLDADFYTEERASAWRTWQSPEKASWSAVGYFFAKRLAAHLGVTVGIVGCNWGGTSASAWVPKSRLRPHEGLRTYLDDFPAPEDSDDYRRPAGLYHCMIERVRPYTLKGFIYYQGESDEHKPHLYYPLFRELIDQWRTDWQDDSLPFIFVQLPEHRYENTADDKSWCLIREAQAKVLATVRNTGMVCALGLGAYNDIHPKPKRELAERLAENALCTAYGLVAPRCVNSPVLRHARPCGSELVLAFDHAEDGFVFRRDERVLEHYCRLEELQGTALPPERRAAFTGFEVAGRDGTFHPAQAAFGTECGRLNTITLSAPEVPEPLHARYAWYNYGPATVYGRNGLPLSPFRTEAGAEVKAG